MNRSLFHAFTVCVLLLASPLALAAPALIPAPAKLQAGDGAFVVDARTPVHAEGAAARAVAERFVEYVARTRDLNLHIASKRANGGIVFAIDRKASSNPEGYSLQADRNGVIVKAPDARGLFYGAITLWQLLEAGSDNALHVPAVRIDDAPRFGWRGLMLDSARHFQTIEEIKQLIDAMALHKLNVFHWHLTDDQGWRIEIKRYPKLTEIGGCRVPAGDAGIGADGKPHQYCGYYTQEQIRDVVRYAAERQITVVPEIDVPGHATAAIAAYPELGISGQALSVGNDWGVYPNLFKPDDATMTFLENVLTEVIALFPGRYIHIGGDEAVKDQWQASAQVQARMRALGVRDETQLQAWMIARLNHFLEAHQRRLIGWDEILDGDLPADATVMSWRGIEGGIAAARGGHDAVMTPSNLLYLNRPQSDLPNEPPSHPGTTTLRHIYDYEPVPATLAPKQRRHIIGVQANLWTEHVRTFARVQHMLFPRLAAVAEIAWSPAERKDYRDFLTRLPAQLPRYRQLGIAYAETPFQVWIDGAGDIPDDKVSITLSNPSGYEDIRYTTDGSAPTAQSQRYTEPFVLKLPAEVKAAVFVAEQAVVAASARDFDPVSLRTRGNAMLASCNGEAMLRIEDDGPREGERAIFGADILNPCWLWPKADLRGIAAIEVRAGRLPYNFQLAHDEAKRKFQPAASPAGELEIRAGCDGEVLGRARLPARPGADGFATLKLPLPLRKQVAAQDVCIVFTGDTRPAMWVVDRVTLLPGKRAATRRAR
ncbi:beta-N-acetylhexosaminidase [Luteimonas panaciterrae]|uniref:beta-N-acetylhexosaminidase n=1 Tax=Luteimonas panaciterrae TaxID=363885 RepID=UPI001CFB1F6D|nr:family 20 glycosylhydrolase [Luteimonas panaciterrae]